MRNLGGGGGGGGGDSRAGEGCEKIWLSVPAGTWPCLAESVNQVTTQLRNFISILAQKLSAGDFF